MTSSVEKLKKKINEAISNNEPDDVCALLKKLDNVINDIQNQFFYEACKQGHIEIVKLLYNTGKNNIQNEIFYEACKQGHIEVVKFLHMKGKYPIIEYKNPSNGYTPLIISIVNKHTEVAKYLIEIGADIQAEATAELAGSNVLSYATENGNLEITELILNDKRITIKDINHQNSVKRSPLSYATNGKNDKIFKILVERGADIHVVDNQNASLLIDVVYYEHIGIIDFLLEKGLKIDHRPNSGDTALMIAVKKNNMNLTIYLLDKGANPLEKDNNGKSVMDLTKNRDMIYLLNSYIKPTQQPEQPTQQPEQPTQQPEQPTQQPTQQPSQPEQPTKFPIKDFIISITKEIQENPAILFKAIIEKIKEKNPDISKIPIEKQFELFENIKTVYNK